MGDYDSVDDVMSALTLILGITILYAAIYTYGVLPVSSEYKLGYDDFPNRDIINELKDPNIETIDCGCTGIIDLHWWLNSSERYIHGWSDAQKVAKENIIKQKIKIRSQ